MKKPFAYLLGFFPAAGIAFAVACIQNLILAGPCSTPLFRQVACQAQPFTPLNPDGAFWFTLIAGTVILTGYYGERWSK
jgi:hypothetical protein